MLLCRELKMCLWGWRRLEEVDVGEDVWKTQHYWVCVSFASHTPLLIKLWLTYIEFGFRFRIYILIDLFKDKIVWFECDLWMNEEFPFLFWFAIIYRFFPFSLIWLFDYWTEIKIIINEWRISLLILIIGQK
jgi:hypothetical protein